MPLVKYNKTLHDCPILIRVGIFEYSKLVRIPILDTIAVSRDIPSACLT